MVVTRSEVRKWLFAHGVTSEITQDQDITLAYHGNVVHLANATLTFKYPVFVATLVEMS